MIASNEKEPCLKNPKHPLSLFLQYQYYLEQNPTVERRYSQ